MNEDKVDESDEEPCRKRKNQNKKSYISDSSEDEHVTVRDEKKKKKINCVSDEEDNAEVCSKTNTSLCASNVLPEDDSDDDVPNLKTCKVHLDSTHLSPVRKKVKNRNLTPSCSDEEDVQLSHKKKKKIKCFSDEEDDTKGTRRSLRSCSKQSYQEDSSDSEHFSKRCAKEDVESDEEYKVSETSSPAKQGNNEIFCTPKRKSSRLHSKDVDKQGKIIPNRRQYLEKISPICTGSSASKSLSSARRIGVSNNFVMGRHSYNTEKCYELDDSLVEDEGFIVSDYVYSEGSDDSEHEHHKHKKKKKGRKVKKIESESEEDASGVDNAVEEDGEYMNCKENYKSEEPVSPEEKKIFPKRTKNKHYEESLRRLRKSRGHQSNEESSDEELPLSQDVNMEESHLLSDEDFIVNDDEYTDDDKDENEHVNDMLKDIVANLKKKGKGLKKSPPFEECSTPNAVKKPVCSSVKNQRVLLYDSSSSDEGSDEFPLSGTNKEFFELVSKNDISGVKSLLKDHDIVNVEGKGKKIALHIAAKLGHLSMIKLLIDISANTRAEDKLRFTPLGYAAKNKHPKCFKFLLEKDELGTFCRTLFKYFDGMSILHLVVSEPLTSRQYLTDDVVECLQVIYNFNKKLFTKFLSSTDSKGNTPLRMAIIQDQVEVVKFLLERIFDENKTSNECIQFKTEEGGNILHFATQHSRSSLAELIPYLSSRINEKDSNGFTPLMYAAERYGECLEVLLNFNASVHVRDKDLVTPLHLAASCGNLQSIKLLLTFGHKVECLDRYGWPALLYANFRASQECVIALFEKNPRQIFCLGNLIKYEQNREQRSKNAKVIQDTLLSISHIDAYYTLFNDFIGCNLSLLDENNHGLFTKTWRAILSFKNKVEWLRKKCQRFSVYSHVEVDRSRVLQSAIEQLPHTFTLDAMNVKFKGEIGSCLGPKREFCSLLVEEMVKPEWKLFTKTDGEQFFPVSNGYFYERMVENFQLDEPEAIVKEESDEKNYFSEILPSHNISDHDLSLIDLDAALDGKPFKRIITKTIKGYKNELDDRLEMMRFVGNFAAQVIMDEEIFVGLHLSKPFVKQVLSIPLNHPVDYSSFDHQVFTSIKDNDIEDLELPFSAQVSNPWNGQLEEIILGEEEHEYITEENKQGYLNSLSEFKLCTSISKELFMFKQGFFNAVRQDVISIFNADEFSLLLNGVTQIDINDWKKNTLYNGWSSSSTVISWFWSTVDGLKEEEKSLLLKFATGTPCVPAGGFSQLVGLGGPNLFTIAKGFDVDKLPEASTCFNRLSLPVYTSEKMLREKLLIAIRHGSEGFAFA